MRTQARETAFEVIFASLFTGEIDEKLAAALTKNNKLSPDDVKYLNKALEIVGAHSEEFAQIIDSRSVAFPEARLFPADKSLLMLALAEIKYMDEIPNVVSVNEAANLASRFSSPKSASFISGILSGVIGQNNG